MAHIAFLMGSFFPENDANVNCANNLMRKLMSEGHQITCVCGTVKENRTDIIDGIKVKRVHHVSYERKYERKGTIQKKVGKFFHFIYSIFVLLSFPDTEPFFSNKLYKELEKVNNDNELDYVIGVFRPFSTISAMIKFKKRHMQIKCAGYYLDILKGAVKPFGIPKSMYYSMCDNKESKAFRKIDVVFMPMNGIRYYENNDLYSGVHMEYVNFPTLILNSKSPKKYYNRVKKIIYAGYMDKDYRNPEELFNIIINVVQQTNIPLEFHLYGRSNLDEKLYEYAQKYPELIFYHGNVSKSTIEEEISKADFLVNIGNKIEGIVPSKIFELFASKKPIIHYSSAELDSSLEYFEKYPDVCILYEKDTVSDNVENMSKFILGEHKEISDEYLLDCYYSATPDAVTHIINEEMRHE